MGIKVEWTKELADDLKNIHGIDIEAELAQILQEEFLKELLNEKKKNKKHYEVDELLGVRSK